MSAKAPTPTVGRQSIDLHISTHARKRWRERIVAFEPNPREAIREAYQDGGVDATLILRQNEGLEAPTVVTVWPNPGDGTEVLVC